MQKVISFLILGLGSLFFFFFKKNSTLLSHLSLLFHLSSFMWLNDSNSKIHLPTNQADSRGSSPSISFMKSEINHHEVNDEVMLYLNFSYQTEDGTEGKV